MAGTTSETKRVSEAAERRLFLSLPTATAPLFPASPETLTL